MFAVRLFVLLSAWMTLASAQAQPMLQSGTGPAQTRHSAAPLSVETAAPPFGQEASAQLLTRITAEDLASLLREVGFTEVRVLTSETHGKYIEARLRELPMQVFFVQSKCTQEGCQSFVYRTVFGEEPSIDYTYINAWHQTYVSSKLFRDEYNSLTLQTGLEMLSALPREYIKLFSLHHITLLQALLQFKPGAR